MRLSLFASTPRAQFGLCLLILAVVGGLGAHSSQARRTLPPNPAPATKQSAFVAGEMLVRFRSEAYARIYNAQPLFVNGATAVTFTPPTGAEIVPGLRLARVAPDATANTLKALNQRPEILYAEPNYRRYALAVPNDANYTQQWSLKNTGQAGGTTGADIKAEPAWDVTTGNNNIVIGIVDEGIDFNHPDLQANIWHNPAETPNNGVDDDGNGYADDTEGWDFFHNDRTVYDGTAGDVTTDEHGTHVAGIAGARGNNGLGIAGVSWNAQLMSLKILGRENELPPAGSVFQTVRAYAYAKQMRDLWLSSGGTRGANIRILNNSYGGPGRSQAELDAINALNSSGILFIAAAGNDGASNDQVPVFPASYDAPNLLAVSASSRTDGFVPFTNGSYVRVHLHAPGAEILSTTPQNTYSVFEGTSMAAPHVAGAAALLWAAQPAATLERVRGALMYSGDLKNFHNVTGRRLNAQSALAALNENDTTPPAAPGNLRVGSQSGRTVDLYWTGPGDDGISGNPAAGYELRFSPQALSNPADFARATPLPGPRQTYSIPGQGESFTANIPLRQRSGFLGLRAIDNAGNAGPIAQVAVTVPLNTADPYIMLTSPAEPLSTGGTRLNLRGDDIYAVVTLPFDVPLFGTNPDSRVYVSTNGALHWFFEPGRSGDANDVASWVTGLHNRFMFAALWDDLRTDRRASDDVYLVQPDANRVIFRWQAVTYNTLLDNGQGRGENPVSFEIELRRDGTIVKRYGAGNQNVFPVVGLSRGQGGAYLAAGHTSETALTSLTNAPTITYALRNPPAPPVADLGLRLAVNPNPVMAGQNVTFNITLESSGTALPTEAIIRDVLPAGLTFVSCTGGNGVTCTGPAVGTSGTVTARVTTFFPNQVTIVARANGAPGSSISNTATVTSNLPDGNPSNNSITAVSGIALGGNLGQVRAVAAGRKHSVAVLQSGAVLTWGWNVLGQLGDGTTLDRPAPAPVAGLSSVTRAVAGSFHTLALQADGTVWAWGYNGTGQLGDGTLTDRRAPVAVNGLVNVVALAAGNSHSVALRADGTVWGWGGGGLVGDGTNSVSAVPVRVVGLSNITAIAARGNHTLALKSDGTVWAWGFNGNGQLGDGTTMLRNAPVQVINLNGVTAIGAGGDGDDHSLAVTQNGTVYGWGYNFKHQIGQPGADFTPRPTPLVINGINGATALPAGAAHSLALKADGTLWGWGDNNNLQLGTGGPSCCTPTPFPLSGIAGVAALAAGDSYNLALLTDGTLRAWGDNSNGQLGDGTTQPHAAPLPVISTPVTALPVLSLASGNYATAQNVTVNCNEAGAVVRYTLDPLQEPNDSAPTVPCGTTFRVDYSLTLKVRAWSAGKFPSALVRGEYIIGATNNIDRPDYFVRQQYLDFLGREPDVAGQNYWQNEVTRCALDRNCTHAQRINISAAFFVEAEFQDTGYYVYRLYRASLGRRPTFGEFTSDRELVTGGATLELLRQAFAQDWTQRPAFLQAYPASLTNAQFVHQLFDTAGLTGFAAERQAEIDAMNTQGRTRAQVLRNVLELPAFRQREYNAAFVLMQYFGYLRREADANGYDFWLDVVTNREPGNYRGMVCAFITSAEYQLRFGTQTPRSNADCAAIP